MDVNNQIIQATVVGKIVFSSLLLAVSWVLSYSGVDIEVFGIFVALIMLDFVTGLMKSWVKNIPIKSKKMRWGIASKFSLILLPIVIGLGAKGIGQDPSGVFVYGMNLLILSEVYSIIGNTYNIRTGNDLPEWDVIALIGKKIRQSMESRDE